MRVVTEQHGPLSALVIRIQTTHAGVRCGCHCLFGLVPKYDVGSTFWSHTSTHYACRRDRNGSDHCACCLDRSFKTIKALNPRSGSPISIYGSLHTPQHTPSELVLTGASSGLCVLYSICSRSLAFTASVCNRMSASLRSHFAIEHISIPICFVMVRAVCTRAHDVVQGCYLERPRIDQGMASRSWSGARCCTHSVGQYLGPARLCCRRS